MAKHVGAYYMVEGCNSIVAVSGISTAVVSMSRQYSSPATLNLALATIGTIRLLCSTLRLE